MNDEEIHYVMGAHPHPTAPVVSLPTLAEHFFVPCVEGGAWLVFDRTTGRGIGLLIGAVKPVPLAHRRTQQVGLGKVSRPLAPIVKDFGPTCLRLHRRDHETRRKNGDPMQPGRPYESDLMTTRTPHEHTAAGHLRAPGNLMTQYI